ncbi:type VI secretion system tip protein VgrG [Massilia sp. G4R7]|uniref:Type VI secretion system tip protein VgrG n=1 Tax=Massilia phyllostachyos TaxID=2898585 RepID=A0ABS8Q5X8_9BURK|nr:type VI secretion system tip protein VgrG [Massilia phyllostachyos]MCD2517133.1 type VI secretion system tip protein VgrG [Massilia phyllostachyos]
MPLLPTQAEREVSVKSALADDVLLFRSMSCSEALGRIFTYRLELSSTKGDIKIADVLGTSMTVVLDLPEGGERYFNGVVTRFAYRGWRDGMASYEAVLHPSLWLLTRSSNCRIFQDKSAIDIVKAVCGDAAYGGLISLDVASLSGTPAARTYCVQYRETDFNFVCRLLEEEGIYFFFKHEDGAHTLVLADSYGAHAPAEGYATVQFRDEDRTSSALEESVTRFAPGGEIQASVYALNDFDFEKVSSSTTGGLLVKATIAAAFGQPSYEQYDYPGRYTAASAGTGFARGRMEALHGQCEQIEAYGTARGLTTGALFTLSDHPRDDQNREFLVTSAETEIVGTAYASGHGQGSTEFRCAFQAVGKEHSYRAPVTARKPFVHGPQTAMVVGKAGEEIWTDKYGRVKVQFHWERDGKHDETSSCWVRVQQGWAGKSWGTMFIPRIGMEVVVSFLEGDPDQPLITGCVYNGDSMPPYALPSEQTKSTIKSNSSKGGGGFNEIRFEDKKDSEEIFIQAEKDFNRVVKNNDTLKVGFDKADKGDQTIEIKNDRSLDVGHDLKEHVANDHTVTIDNNQTVKITGDQKVTVSKTIVVEATTSIELKVGGSSIKIEPAKITLKSTQIAIEAEAAMDIKAGAMMNVKSGAPMSVKSDAIVTIEGALVKIN